MDTVLEQKGNLLSRLTASVRRVLGSGAADRRQADRPAIRGNQQLFSSHAAHEFDSWTPLLVANAVIASGFAAVAVEDMAPVPILWWVAAAISASLLPAVTRALSLRFGPSSTSALINELWAGLLGLIWAVLPLLFFDSASPNVRVLAVALVFAIASIGSLALTTLPRAAIVFCAMITGSMVFFAHKLGGHAGYALGFMTFFYSLSTIAMILRSHEAAIKRDGIEGEVKKQNEIISLLLNDFSDHHNDWLWESDHDGRITYASRGLAAGLGLSPDAIIGRRLDDLVHATGDAPGWHELQSTILRRKPIDSATVELPLAQGNTWWQIAARPMFAGSGEFLGYRGVAHDVTAERRTTQRLLAEKEAAERSSATKSQFLAVMSHELRTPLNAIVGFAELLGSAQAEYLTSEARADHLRTIRDSSQHLQNLINDILDAARIEKGTMKLVEQETDAAELVEVAVKMCREAAERSDTTVIARVIDGVEIRCDMTRVKQVLINLITNALKFSPTGGFVNVAFEQGGDGSLSILVRDEGVGIRREDLQRIFEPYVQADEGMARRFGGAGLGLAIAKRIATLHGGDVTIESEYGIGTTARLTFPPRRVTWPEPTKAAATLAA